MSQDKIVLAIFDFDGTLTDGHMWSGIARYHRQNKLKTFALYSYLFYHIPIWLASKLKLYSDDKTKIKWGEDLPSLIKGFTTEEAGKLFNWLADVYFLPRLRPDVMRALKEHQKKGHKTMILSGMFSDFLEVLITRIGVDYVVGTKLEKTGQVYSGRIIKPLCFGDEKANLLAGFIKEKGLDVDFSRSTAYADSLSDVPVLRMVGNPVATYPEKDLHQLALSRKWQVLGAS